MIQIEKMYKDIVTITEDNYTTDRFSIMENLFNELDINILDFEIRIKQKEDILGRYVDIVPYSLEENLLSILEKLSKMEEESEEDLVFIIKLLAIMKMGEQE